MNRIWKEIGIAVWLGLVMPALLLHLIVKDAETVTETKPVSIQEPEEKTELLIPVLTGDATITNMELNDYLTGVVLAEMPASFEVEALKAQAVVARTYTLRAYYGTSKHDHATVCTDSNCCQGYKDPHDYLAAGGLEENIEKVQRAVNETSGYVLTYDGELIEATYFSCSGGRTEDAVAVWGADVPYLRSVASPGEEKATYYTDEVHFTVAELEDKLDTDLSDEPTDLIDDISYTAGGGVDQIAIGEKQFRGTELRKLLGLRSTAFAVSVEDGGLTFITRGYGHRVGMSQYGADAMALDGSTYREILMHYYPGTTLEHRTD